MDGNATAPCSLADGLHGRDGRWPESRNSLSRLVPEERVELSRGCPRGILSPLRLPFRHSGECSTLGRSDPLDVPLLGEHAFREVQPLLDIGEPSLHVFERVEPCLDIVTAAHALLQIFD